MNESDPGAMDMDPSEQLLGAGQADPNSAYGDSNADGIQDTIAVANPDGTTSVFTDMDQSGLYEGATVFRADGSPAVTMQDADEDGNYETAAVDQSGDGVVDTYAVDTTADGVFDTRIDDLNQNGVADSEEVAAPVSTGAGQGVNLVGGSGWSFSAPDAQAGTTEPGMNPTLVGPVTNPDPVYQLIVDLAGETGMVAYGPDDTDHDGVYDNYDNQPHDPFER